MELLPLGRWAVVIALLWVAALPLARWLLPASPHRGAAFALPIAIVIASLVTYWVGKLHLGVGVVAGLLAVVLAGKLAHRKTDLPEPRRLAAPVVVFVAAFLVMLAVRVGDPRIVPPGGEKFLDFALLNAVHAAPSLPPEDPWFAGEAVRYYYGSYLSGSILTIASGLEPRIAYNLLIPTWFATLATGAYGLAAAIAVRADRPHRLAGVIAALVVATAGTLATPGRFVLAALPEAIARAYGRALVVGIRAPVDEAFATATAVGDWSPWLGRYVVPRTVHVFPGWAFLNGDLRPHMASAPLLALAGALAWALYRTPADATRRRWLLLGGALPALAGWTLVVDTWAGVIVVGLVGVTVATAPAPPGATLGVLDPTRRLTRSPVRTVTRELSRLLAGGVAALLVALLGIVWVWPYVAFRTAPNEGIGFAPPGSPAGPFLLVFGGFLVVFALVLLEDLRADGSVLDRLRERPNPVSDAERIDRSRRSPIVWAVFLGGALLAGVVLSRLLAEWVDLPGLLAGAIPVGVTVAVGLAAWAVLAGGRRRFALVLVIAGAGLIAGTELAYLKVWPYNPDVPRWNTIYKVVHAVWVLWGVAFGAAIAALVARARDHLAPNRHTLGAVLAVVLLAGMLTFPALGFGGQAGVGVAERQTLDGLAWVEDAHPDEAAAMAWLDDRSGRPTIAEHPTTAIYQWGNAPSALTDAVSVAGWDHQKGYRGVEAYEARAEDLARLFEGSPTTRIEIAEHYGVEYIYVGPNEREAYDLGAIGTHDRIEAVFEQGPVTIYAVRSA